MSVGKDERDGGDPLTREERDCRGHGASVQPSVPSTRVPSKEACSWGDLCGRDGAGEALSPPQAEEHGPRRQAEWTRACSQG